MEYPKDQSGAMNTVIYGKDFLCNESKHSTDTLEEDLFIRSALSRRAEEIKSSRKISM